MVDLFSDPILPDRSSSPATSAIPASPSILHIEVALKETVTCRFDAAHRYAEIYLRENYTALAADTEIRDFDRYAPILKNNVDRIHVVSVTNGSSSHVVRLEGALLSIHVYQLHDRVVSLCDVNNHDSENGQTVFASATDLPAKSLDGLWDTLVFDEDLIKGSLLNYISSVMLFSEKKVNPQIITFQRLVLLHGPPGTGKTSLCRALAQKLAIRLSNRYTSGKLIEVSASALFSRFFSESAKLVSSLFEKIYEMTEDEESYICVLIDEVESLTTARSSTIGTEPSDAMRVVNVLLTQLDRLKTRPNVLLLTTSNLLEASDRLLPFIQESYVVMLTISAAFLDRADIIQYIGNPGSAAVYQILRSCLMELMRAGIVQATSELRGHNAALLGQRSDPSSASSILLDISAACTAVEREAQQLDSSQGIQKPSRLDAELKERKRISSARSLRRLPLLAHAQHIRRTGQPCTLNEMLSAIYSTATEQHPVSSA